MKTTRLLAISLACLTAQSASAATRPAGPKGTEDRLPAMRAFFKGAEVRHPGSPGNLEMERRVARRFSDTARRLKDKGVKHGEIQFTAAAFLPGKTTIQAGDLPPVAVQPMHPTLFRPGNFPSKDFETRLVFLGQGTLDDLKALSGKSLEGALALMEFHCRARWQRFLRFGIKGFVFIEPKEHIYSEATTKVYASEVAVPRFFVSAADGARLRQALSGSGRSLPVRVKAEPSRWQNRQLRNLWIFIPGSSADLQKEVGVFVAPLDSNCVVPERATGAQSAANLFLLMRLLEDFEKTPPGRSVILAAVNAHTQNHLGERMLAWHLLAPSAQIEDVRNRLAMEMRTQGAIAKQYERLDLSPARQQETELLLIDLRTLEDTSTGAAVSVKEPIVALARRDVNQIKMDKLVIQRSSLSEAEKQAKIEKKNELYNKHVNVLTLFNRVGIKTKLGELSEEEKAILGDYIAEIVARNKNWAKLNRTDLDIDLANGKIRRALAGRTVPMIFTLDLTWLRDSIGLTSLNTLAIPPNNRWGYNFGKNATRVAQALARREGIHEDNPFINTMSGSKAELYYFPQNKSAVHCFHAINHTPAFSLRNVFSGARLAFTPGDTFDRLPRQHVARLMGYVPRLFRALLADRDITSSAQLTRPKPSQNAYTTHVKAFKFDPFSASVDPELAVPNSVIILSTSGLADPMMDGDVVAAQFLLTDSRASRFFYCLDVKQLTSNAFGYDKDFTTVNHAIDAGEAQQRVNSNVTKRPTQLLALFPCKEITLYERDDPSLVSAAAITVQQILPLGASRDAILRRYGTTGVSALSEKWIATARGPAAVFIEEDEFVKMLTQHKRLALNTTDREPEGVGFTSTRELGPDFYATAVKDMSRLNHFRLGKMQGVTNKLAEDFLARGDAAVRETVAAKARKDHVGYLRSLYEALGAQTKAYDWISSITNDMLKAVVFYMALLLPFCFFLQKLLFKFVRIEAQMGVFAVLFIITYLVFRFIHPAFMIAEAPEAIFIAFVMGALALFVIYILHTRFEGEMQLLFRTFTGMDTTKVGYSTVSREAMLIGVNNMKRRRIRTTLTTGTIVLVTFSMLAFSSVSQKMSPTVKVVTKEAPYTGVFYSWPGNARMDEATLQVFLDLFAGQGEVVVRRWLLPPKRKQAAYEFRAGCSNGEEMQVEGVLGLSLADNGFLAEFPLLPGGRYFSSDTAKEAILPVGAAEALKIKPDQVGKVTLTYYDEELTVVGLVDDQQLRAIKDLNDWSILPIKDIQTQEVGDTDLAAQEGGLTAEESGVFFVHTPKLILMPAGTVQRLGGIQATTYSLSVRFPDETPVWPIIDRILTVTKAKFHVGSRVPFTIGKGSKRANAPGVYYVGSGYRTSIGGLTRLIIPLLIAATIIFNTLLGTVYERKDEIGVYNAVGLNPTHIGMFFLAEAFVYSVIGSVGGYLIGQALAIALKTSKLVKGINLNFSSLSVVYVIMFTIGVVLLSTLYPAVVATRTAVPSGKRKWSMPDRVGNLMTVKFPFIYQPSLVGGIMAYLEEYLAGFTEASTGNLVATLETKTKETPEQGRDTYSLGYVIALAPFDLGVTQRVTFHAEYEPVVQNYRITMNIVRLSGQDSNWMTTNKPFLDRLRKYLMHWRNLDPAQHELYRRRAAELFADGEESAAPAPGNDRSA